MPNKKKEQNAKRNWVIRLGHGKKISLFYNQNTFIVFLGLEYIRLKKYIIS